MFTKLAEWLPANRVAAIVAFLTAIGGALAVLQTSFVPGSPAAEALGKGVAFLGSAALALGTIYKFLDGAQNSETLMVTGAPRVKGLTVVNNNYTTEAAAGAVAASASNAPKVVVPPGMTEAEAAARLHGFAKP